MDLKDHIRQVPDFPKPGILFYDISTLLEHPGAWKEAVGQLKAIVGEMKPDLLAGIESRGFLTAAPLALELGLGFIMVRKKGKLPYDTHEESYDLEYGSNTVALHIDAVNPGDRVLLVDDLLATGGTAAAAAKLLRKIDANILEIRFLIELGFLNGSEKLDRFPVKSLVNY